MPGYAKVTAEASGEFNVTKENFGKINNAIFDLKYQFINVKDYGATGDGVTDDTAAIQAAINEIPIINILNGSGRAAVVFFPAGTYIVSTLTAPTDSATYVSSYGNFITLMGVGKWRGSRIKRKAATNLPLLDLSGTNTAGTIRRQAGWNVVNLNLDGGGIPASPAAPLLRCYYNSNTFVDGVAFDNNNGPAVEGVEFQDSRFQNCWFNYCMGTTETVNDGTTTGTETLRLLGRKDGNPTSTTFGYTTDNCNNIHFIGCEFTSGVDNGSGAIALSENATTGASSPHRIYFVDNKIENGLMKGDIVKLLGKNSRVQWIYFVNCDFTGYSRGSTSSAAITWINANIAYSVNIHNALFDDAGGAGITHAPMKLTDCAWWSLTGTITTNLGTALGGDTTAAALIHCGFQLDKPIYLTATIRHEGRLSPRFTGARILDIRTVSSSAINVKDFGAKGDGTTDDTVAIQAAINSCPIVDTPTGSGTVRAGTVFFPPGTYIVSQLVMPNDQATTGGAIGSSGTAWGNAIKLLGAGTQWYGAVIKRKTATDLPLIDVSGTIAAGPTIKRSLGFSMENLTIHGNNATKPLIRAYYVSTAHFRGIRFASNNGPAVEGVEFQDSRFETCWFSSCCGTVGTTTDGTATGTESVRLLGLADGNPASAAFGWTNDNCNNIYFTNCLWTSNNANSPGAFVASQNATAGVLTPHRIYFVNNKFEWDNLKQNGAIVTTIGGASRVKWIHFVNVDLMIRSMNAGVTSGGFMCAFNDTHDITMRNVLFDDANAANKTYAPIYGYHFGAATIEDVTTNLGAPFGGDTNAAKLIWQDNDDGSTLKIGLVDHLGSRTSPLISDIKPANFITDPKGGASTQTPGAVTTVNIAHGLGYTPALISVEAGDANARGAPSMYISADGTNVILNFSAALTAATAYTWRWIAS